MLGEKHREVLAGLADVLLPAFGELPAASTVGVERRWIDRAIAARPDLESVLADALDAARDVDPATALQRLRAEDGPGFEAFAMLVTWAYYAHPKVRARLGYPGQRAAPFAPEDADYYLDDGILDAVVARGAIYLPTPPSGPSSRV